MESKIIEDGMDVDYKSEESLAIDKNLISYEDDCYFIDFSSFSNLDHAAAKSKCHSKFNKGFTIIKDFLKIEKATRKTQFDSILKKAKARIFRVIHDSMKKCLTNPLLLLRLPQNFITNIKIEFNKKYFKKNIYEIYSEHQIFSSLEDLFENNFIKEERKNIFKEFINLTLKEFYEYYITSKQYLYDRVNIKKKEGEKISILFAYIAQNFYEYYTQSKGNQPKIKKKLQAITYNKSVNSNNNSDFNGRKFFKVI